MENQIETAMTFEQYEELCKKRMDDMQGTVRVGQMAFIALEQVRPDLAEKIRGHAMLDPFYEDAHFLDFTQWLVENW